MGNRANFVVVQDQDWRRYYAHWAGCRMLDALCGSAPRLSDLDLAAGGESAQTWIRKPVYQSYADSPAGHIAELAKLLEPLAPGLSVQRTPLSTVECGPPPLSGSDSLRRAMPCTRTVPRRPQRGPAHGE